MCLVSRSAFTCIPTPAGSDLEYSHLILARNGKRMVSVSRSPHSQLVFWDLSTTAGKGAAPANSNAAASSSSSGAPITAVKLVDAPLTGDDVFYASFNPRSKRQFVIGNQRALTVWQIDTKFDQYSLARTDYALEADDASREILCHCWTADDRLLCGTPYGELLLRCVWWSEAGEGKIIASTKQLLPMTILPDAGKADHTKQTVFAMTIRYSSPKKSQYFDRLSSKMHFLITKAVRNMSSS
jgi:hypothetical protein